MGSVLGTKTFSFFQYNQQSSLLLKKIKYRHQPWLLEDFLENIPWVSWLRWLNNIKNLNQPKLVFVPLSDQSTKQRGFNQSIIMAEFVSRLFGFLTLDCLQKVKNNQKQAMIKGFAQRQANVVGAYLAKNKTTIKQQNLIIVDDVITTGATVREISKILKQAGANQVWALSLFRGG